MKKKKFLLRGTLQTAYQIYQEKKRKIKVFLSRQFCDSLGTSDEEEDDTHDEVDDTMS